ncbi:MAG TPA: hypothetical protein PLU22_06685 [Polyangiaceae bacterium]|nr:hypothetical protein [Polyangiaceae bacterium]
MSTEDETGRERPADAEAPDPRAAATAGDSSPAAGATRLASEDPAPEPAPAGAGAEAAPDDTEAAPDGLGEGDAALGRLLRGALGEEPETPDVLRGVQRKLRVRSGGKFFSDGWSTERQPPIQTYLVTSLVMLAVILAIWAVLYPISGSAVLVEPPAPVRVLPPP